MIGTDFFSRWEKGMMVIFHFFLLIRWHVEARSKNPSPFGRRQGEGLQTIKPSQEIH
jgi:hypothetical protein